MRWVGRKGSAFTKQWSFLLFTLVYESRGQTRGPFEPRTFPPADREEQHLDDIQVLLVIGIESITYGMTRNHTRYSVPYRKSNPIMKILPHWQARHRELPCQAKPKSIAALCARITMRKKEIGLGSKGKRNSQFMEMMNPIPLKFCPQT